MLVHDLIQKTTDVMLLDFTFGYLQAGKDYLSISRISLFHGTVSLEIQPCYIPTIYISIILLPLFSSEHNSRSFLMLLNSITFPHCIEDRSMQQNIGVRVTVSFCVNVHSTWQKTIYSYTNTLTMTTYEIDRNTQVEEKTPDLYLQVLFQ